MRNKIPPRAMPAIALVGSPRDDDDDDFVVDAAPVAVEAREAPRDEEAEEDAVSEVVLPVAVEVQRSVVVNSHGSTQPYWQPLLSRQLYRGVAQSRQLKMVINK